MARRRRKKKAEFEMLIISFCDIITISTAALLLALFVTVQLAIKIPVFRPTPRSAPSSKQAFFFECRNDHLFFVDKAGLDEQVEELMSKLNSGVRGGDLGSFQKAIQGQEVGNPYYKVDPRYLLVGRMVLETRAGTSGEGAGDLENPNSKYQAMLSLLDKDKQYIAFLVRDDSFNVFRKARQVADSLGLDTGWELLGIDEQINFGEGGIAIGTQ
jgi:biopolymer transport protein ExbD